MGCLCKACYLVGVDMSFNSHQRKVRDERLPLPHRASHARSCALHLANRLGVTREEVIQRIQKRSGVDLLQPEGIAPLLLAFDVLLQLRAEADSG